MHTQRNHQGWFPGSVVKLLGIERGENVFAEASETSHDGNDSDNSLEDVARDEHEYLRGRLRDELKREPSEEEMNEWLRQHTEGY